MKLFIKIENGLPVNNPAEENNIKAAFPDVDLATTTDFAPFIRTELPTLTLLQVAVPNHVLMDDGKTYTDDYSIRDMDTEEVAQITSDYNAGIKSSIESYIDYANTNIADADINDLPVWQTYLDAITAFTYTDPFAAIIPRPPYKDKNGNLMSTSNAGAKPNVIG